MQLSRRRRERTYCFDVMDEIRQSIKLNRMEGWKNGQTVSGVLEMLESCEGHIFCSSTTKDEELYC